MNTPQSHNKCVEEATHWLKKHVCIFREFSIVPGDSNLAVLLYMQDPWKYFIRK